MSKFRVCLIGNSHSACFKIGWDAISNAFPDVSIQFFYGRLVYQDGFSASIADGKLVLSREDVRLRIDPTTGSDVKIDLQDFDVCLSLGSITWWAGVDRRLYSKQLTDLALRSFVQQSQGFKLLTLIRKISNLPVRIIQCPFYATRGLGLGKGASSYLNEIKQVNEKILFEHNAELYNQPVKTFDASLTSLLKYAVSFRAVAPPKIKDPSAPPQRDDLRHMDGAYGALFLVEIFEKLGILPIESALKMPTPIGHLSGEQKYLFAQANN